MDGAHLAHGNAGSTSDSASRAIREAENLGHAIERDWRPGDSQLRTGQRVRWYSRSEGHNIYGDVHRFGRKYMLVHCVNDGRFYRILVTDVNGIVSWPKA